MEEVLLFLNQPTVLLVLFAGAIVLVLIDYLFPVDWPAYVGYGLFAIFIGATAPVAMFYSIFLMLGVFVLMLVLHMAVFAKFLTNAPRHERKRIATQSINEPVHTNESSDIEGSA